MTAREARSMKGSSCRRETRDGVALEDGMLAGAEEDCMVRGY